MIDRTNATASQWNASTTVKARNAVQRYVTALLDHLAPERAVKRVDDPPRAIEQHRTPSGCVLQAPTAAVSISWFPDTSANELFGELQITVWEGTVTRRGTAQNRKRAVTVAELALRPIEPPVDGLFWEATDGTRYDTVTLAAKCHSLLKDQIAAQAGS